jgi:GT2 family glycosyltransferase
VKVKSITAIVPTYCRVEGLEKMLATLLSCDPQPFEIIVHVDASDHETIGKLAKPFPSVRWMQSNTTMGPGGGRNRLIAAAKSDWVASFDDDSWPIETNFFSTAAEIIGQNDCDLVACNIRERDQPQYDENDGKVIPVSWFEGCGCLIRRSSFETVGGFVPLRYAYGMEESDLAIKLIDADFNLIYASQLRVFHDCDRESHHANPRINAAQITNIGLLCFLRYPVVAWPIGAFQVFNRVLFCLKTKRWSGIVSGVLAIPSLCRKHARERQPVSYTTFCKSRRLRGSPRSSSNCG